ncbi:MAG: hypothetical protein AVDCRST_MAG76-1235 [uncultured Acidimicrobiales bacterium]|uniref:Uncharacterized protein n=1 Tax=uncultured Acidimicrobiales bacterium TaxID=310071 RepID=A0A6J4HRE0_9ACTN|nr:MAG: hypothetical protein AVDCRST_MAG76-1235 [uncultured Acidimicrobiales bacterium]
MPKRKVSLTVDPAKVCQLRELFGATMLSKLVDMALDQLIVNELERRHVAGYRAQPAHPFDEAWAEVEREPVEIADDTDWARLYGLHPPR